MTHDINTIKEKWNEIKAYLIDECYFNEFLSGELTFDKWHYNYANLVCKKYWIRTGASRAVFGTRDDDTVVFKILIDRNDIDYNASESYVYDCACKEKLDYWFAWTQKIDTIEYEGVFTDVYAMDYCKVDPDTLEERSLELSMREYCSSEGIDYDELDDDGREEVCNQCGWDYGEPDDIEQYMYYIYDTKEVGELYNFLYKLDVNDTHSGNWGLKDNHWVLIDYAGYGHDVRKVA